MTALNVKIPAIAQQYYKSTDVPQIATQMSIITRLYSGVAGNIGKLSNVPSNLIYAFIFIESRGDKAAYNAGSGATGLMQVSPISATDIIIMENKAQRLNAGEIKILERHLGASRTKELLSLKLLGSKQIIKKEDLLIPELNILIGTIFLGLLIDEHEEGSGSSLTTRLDKVIIRYNQGYYSHKKGEDLKGNIASIVNTVPTETKDYIVKLLGKNGILDITT